MVKHSFEVRSVWVKDRFEIDSESLTDPTQEFHLLSGLAVGLTSELVVGVCLLEQFAQETNLFDQVVEFLPRHRLSQE